MIKTNRKSRSRERNRIGATTVEMALILPLFLAITFACMEFTRISMVRSQVSNAAYEAARSAMVLGGVDQTAEDAAANALSRLGVSDATTVVVFTDEDGVPVTSEIAELVTVQIDVPYASNSFFGAFLSPDSNHPESISLSNAVISSQVTLRTNTH
jgi:Flp pilus assembly protein TadG